MRTAGVAEMCSAVRSGQRGRMERQGLLRPEQRRSLIEQVPEGKPPRLPPGEDRPLQIGSEVRQPQQPPMVGRGGYSFDHRLTTGILPEHRVSGAERGVPGQRLGSKQGGLDRPRPPC